MFKKKYLQALNFITASALILGTTQAFADPPTLPPSIPAPPIYCFAVTGAAHSGSGVLVQFEILNWTDEAFDGFHVSLNTDPALTTGGLFGATPDPFAGPFLGKANTNDWGVLFSLPTDVSWSAGTALGFTDIDPNNDGDYADLPALPSPIDSGTNVLDGFVLNMPNLDVNERVIFDWTSTAGGSPVASDNGGFSFGTFQIDRAADGAGGEVRLSTFFGFGVTSLDIVAPPPLDPFITDQNAVTVPAVAAVPVPAAVWLFVSGLLGLTAVARRRRV